MPAQSMPAAEVEVTVDLARRLLTAQCPELVYSSGELELTYLAEGWDNVMLRLGEEFVVRLPRRAAAAQLLVNEQRWLPHVAPGLPSPLRVPLPVHAGLPGEGYPWAWSVLPYLPGAAAALTPPSDPGDAAGLLGGFLGALHVPAPGEFPLNRARGVPLADRDTSLSQTLQYLDGDLATLAGIEVQPEVVRRLWGEALAAPVWDGPPLWLHGDLHPGNLLVHEGRLSSVVDFGDITAGDPATDLSVAWMLLPLDVHELFRDAYERRVGCAVDDATWRRAWGWALSLSVAFLAYSADNPMIAGIGRRTLRAVLAGA